MIRVSRKGGGGELLHQATDGIAVSPHAPFFNHYVAFLVKFAHHGMQKAFGFEIRPKLKSIFRQRVVISSLVVTGEGVHVLAAVLFHELAKGVAYDDFG